MARIAQILILLFHPPHNPLQRLDIHRLGQVRVHAGLEALFGALYLLGRTERLMELFQLCVEG